MPPKMSSKLYAESVELSPDTQRAFMVKFGQFLDSDSRPLFNHWFLLHVLTPRFPSHDGTSHEERELAWQEVAQDIDSEHDDQWMVEIQCELRMRGKATFLGPNGLHSLLSIAMPQADEHKISSTIKSQAKTAVSPNFSSATSFHINATEKHPLGNVSEIHCTWNNGDDSSCTDDTFEWTGAGVHPHDAEKFAPSDLLPSHDGVNIQNRIRVECEALSQRYGQNVTSPEPFTVLNVVMPWEEARRTTVGCEHLEPAICCVDAWLFW